LAAFVLGGGNEVGHAEDGGGRVVLRGQGAVPPLPVALLHRPLSYRSQTLVHFSRLDEITLPLATGENEDMSLMERKGEYVVFIESDQRSK
jgi:hypothetical protein